MRYCRVRDTLCRTLSLSIAVCAWPAAAEVLEAVVVSATPLNTVRQVNLGGFGERNVLDIPLSIQSYSAADIDNRAARTLLDVLQAEPSVQAASVGGAYDNLRLRGFAIDFTNTLRRDGLSLAPFQDVAQENIDRIDILNGPSGFLYGLNSPGGTINYIVKRPAQRPFTTITAELTSLNGHYVALDSNLSSNGGFGLRWNAAYEKDGDFNHAGDLERVFVSLAVDLNLGARTLLQINADLHDVARTTDPLLRADQRGRANPLDPASYVRPPRIDRRDLLAPSAFRYQTNVLNIDAKLSHELGREWFVVTQANYSRNRRDEAFQDLFDIQPDGTIASGDLFLSPDARPAVGSLQLYFGGPAQTGGLQHEIFIGASAKRFDHPQNESFVLPVSVGNVLRPVDPGALAFGPHVYSFKSVVDETSVFASDLVSLTERWQLLAGGRYITYSSYSEDAAGVRFEQQHEQVFAPSVGIIFKPTPAVTTYANYSRGIEQGEFAPFFANKPREQTAPLKAIQYEVGTKISGRSFNLELALFQIERQAAYVNLDNDFVADGTQRHRGVELHSGLAIGDGLQLTLGLGYLSTRLLDVAEPATRNRRTEGVPRYSAGASLEWRVPFIDGLTLGSALTVASSRPIDPQNSGFIDGYQVVDASVRYATHFGTLPMTLRMNVSNLFDRYYYSSAFFQGGLGVGQPREFKLSASTSF